MLDKLNHYIGILFLAAIIGGGAFYAFRGVFLGPPLPHKLYQAIQARQGQGQATYDFERHMQDLQEQQAQALQNAIEVGRSATGS
jgi:hypothetical protein